MRRYFIKGLIYIFSNVSFSFAFLAGDMLTANGQGMTVTYQLISKAVETSQRGISRSAVLGNLDLILEKEVKAGHFIRIGKDEYKLPYLPNGPIGN